MQSSVDCSAGLDSRPGLLSAGVTFFRGNDTYVLERQAAVVFQSSFRPSEARAGIQPSVESIDVLDSRPGLLSAGVRFFRGNDKQEPDGDLTHSLRPLQLFRIPTPLPENPPQNTHISFFEACPR